MTKLDSEKLILVHPVTGQLHVTSKGTKYVEQKRARATHLVAVEVRGSKAVSATFVPQ